MADHHKKRIDTIFFDADGTLLENENPYLFLAKKLGCYRTVKARVIQFLEGEITYEMLLETEKNVFKQRYQDLYKRPPKRGDLEKLYGEKASEIKPGVAQIIQKLINMKITPYVLSSGFTFLVNKLEEVSIAPENIYANSLAYDEDDNFSHFQIDVPVEKISSFRKIIDSNGLEINQIAYMGDNRFDKPMLNFVSENGGLVFLYNDGGPKIFDVEEMPDNVNYHHIKQLSSIFEFLE